MGFARLPGKIARLAERQYGHVTRTQLLALGMSSSAIARLVAAGLLIRVHTGVYAVGHRQIEAVAVAAAAWLACGPDAVVSHETAAALWGIRRRWPRAPEISCAGDHRRAGIRHHRCQPARGQIRRHRGLRVTSPERTLNDIRPRLTAKQFARAVNDARLARLLSLAEAQRLTGTDTPRRPTRSGFEDDVLSAISDRGLPTPEVNSEVEGFEVDLFFRAHGLAVEIDGYRYHADPRTFARERRESEALAAAGHALIRISDERWRQNRDGALDTIETTLRNRGFAP